MATWLHVSDFHIRGGDPYDRDVVLRALVASVRRYRELGRKPDLIFATGDVAHSGKPAEYELATPFFDALLDAAGLERRDLFVIPGNHDVDRNLGIGLARTLDSREQADDYFGPAVPKIHLTQKLGAFRAWHNRYFQGIRDLPEGSTCNPVEAVDVGGQKLGVLAINTALFCQDDQDHSKLVIGRRCLDSAIEELRGHKADLNVALFHHPLDWLSDLERSNIKANLQASVDVILRGHLHETDVESVVTAQGGALHVAAGAAYQSRKWPNRALYATFERKHLTVFAIRYEDQPQEIWTTDPSLFPTDAGHERRFEIPRLAGTEVAGRVASPAKAEPSAFPRFRSNILSRRDLPFVGREKLLEDILAALGDPSIERTLILHGPPGVGKSELAREFARRSRDRYPGGTFFIDAGTGALVDLVRIGVIHLSLSFPPGFSLQDQCEQTLLSFGRAPVLLIYDNAYSDEAVQPFLPRSGMPCHVLITTLSENWGPGWRTLDVDPLSNATSLELIEQLAGREVAERHGRALAAMAEGLPIQICPAAATLAYEARRGRLDSVKLALTPEARASFGLVYDHLEPRERLFLHAAAFLNSQRIAREELSLHLEAGAGWSTVQFERSLDACLDLNLLEGGVELRMHQLFATFLLAIGLKRGIGKHLEHVRHVQGRRFVEVAKGLAAHPEKSELALALAVFPLKPQVWSGEKVAFAIEDGESIGAALEESGRFEDAREWFQKVVEGKENGVDQASLGVSLHQVGYCLSAMGKHEEAQDWFERAVAAKEKGDARARVDHADLGASLHEIGRCLSETGRYEEALGWYERAAAAQEKGDVHGRIDNENLGRSLHEVGRCLSKAAQYEEAREWYERAVATAEKGDLHGRIDHTRLGASLHQVGWCFSKTGKHEVARVWYERALAAGEQGDVHGRVDHARRGLSLHQIGWCLTRAGKYEEAVVWFVAAVAASEKGDVYGRVSHESLGRSFHWVGWCLRQMGKDYDAKPWFEKAVAAKRKGDVVGRVDRESLAKSLREGAGCLRMLEFLVEATAWEEEAAQLAPSA